MVQHWAVVGGGFRGLIGAYMLAKRGLKVTLLEQNKELGGVMSSIPWKGFFLDKGCHLFANDQDEVTAILLDILGDDYSPVDTHYASITRQTKTDGIAIPDLSAFGKEDEQRMLYELVYRLGSEESGVAPANLRQALTLRFGNTAGGHLADAAAKQYQIDPSNLEASALDISAFRRIKFLDDDIAIALKKMPYFDDRIAASSQADPMKFYRAQAQEHSFRNFYPKHKGLRGFSDKARERLLELGCDIRTEVAVESLDLKAKANTLSLSNGESLGVDRLLWTSGLELLQQVLGWGGSLESCIHRVPAHFHYFVIEKSAEGPYTYIQNFDPQDMIFRASIPGGYIEESACPAGLSYVCCEVPTRLDSPDWANHKALAGRVWNELVRYQVVADSKPIDTLSVAVPATVKLPKLGFDREIAALMQKLEAFPSVVTGDDRPFSKTGIIQALSATLNAQ